MFLFIAWDGDHIGRQVGQLALADDAEGLRRVSQAIEAGNRLWESWVNQALGEMISYGGDEGRAKVPADKVEELQKVRQQYESTTGSTCSVGIGIRLSEADRALLASKLRGGDQVVLYTPEIEPELEQMQEQTEAQKLGSEYLKKADAPEPPAPNEAKENKGNAGGGFSGRHEPGTGGEPVGPMAEASEHSQGEAMNALMEQQSSPEGTHAAADFEDELHGHAQEGNEEDSAQAQQDQAQDKVQQAKQQVVEILQQVRQVAPQMEQLRDQAPDLYAAMQGVVQALLITAKALIAPQEDQQQPQQQGEQEQSQSAPEESSVAKSEAPPGLAPPPPAKLEQPQLHGTVEGFMAGLKAIPKGTPARGKFITQHMNHGPFIQALQAHPQGPKVHAMLTQHLNGAQNAGFKPGATQAVVKAECKHFFGKGGKCLKCKTEKDSTGQDLEKGKLPLPEHAPKHNHLNLPVGSTKDGKVKVQHKDDGKTSWVSVRAGQVLSNDGHPVSSRNPNGK